MNYPYNEEAAGHSENPNYHDSYMYHSADPSIVAPGYYTGGSRYAAYQPQQYYMPSYGQYQQPYYYDCVDSGYGPYVTQGGASAMMQNSEAQIEPMPQWATGQEMQDEVQIDRGEGMPRRPGKKYSQTRARQPKAANETTRSNHTSHYDRKYPDRNKMNTADTSTEESSMRNKSKPSRSYVSSRRQGSNWGQGSNSQSKFKVDTTDRSTEEKENLGDDTHVAEKSEVMRSVKSILSRSDMLKENADVVSIKPRELSIRSERGSKNREIRPNSRDVKPVSTKRGKDWTKDKIWMRTNYDNDESQRGSLIEQLRNDSYECMVCCEVVRCAAAVWCCNNCYHVFHLHCIKKWARTSTVEEKDSSGWRCPACQNVCERFPSQYRCFCGKRRDPEWNRFETPHSCGEVCRKSRDKNCRHPCNILCHPGPCPPCHANIRKTCDCGKISDTVKCGQVTQLKCNNSCKRTLNCGKHECAQSCHSGPCDTCSEELVQNCCCGQTERKVTCGTQESFQTSFTCSNRCNRLLECGNHHCSQQCHPGPCDPCTLTPDLVTSCPCGKSPLIDLMDEGIGHERTSCVDPIPTCGQKCHRSLGCGSKVAGRQRMHICESDCHEGPCPSCDKMTTMMCRCGNTEKDMPCSDIGKYTESNPLLCDRRCNKKRQCGRHKCNQVCCVDTEHKCLQICGKKLTCGLHKCEELCHKTKCPPCWQASFDELKCHCGSEVIYPPVPCGTRPPECNQPCTRSHECDHQVMHVCHNDERCPPCTVLTQRMCMGGHQLRKNIACHVTDISCGLQCEKPLACGLHKCGKICHKDGCMKEADVCKMPCVLARDCGHQCAQSCHPDDACPKVPCRAQIQVKCLCGERKEILPCYEGAKKSDSQRFSNFALRMGQSSIDLTDIHGSGKDRYLDCNEECAKVERNKRIALALEIKNPDLYSKLGNPLYSDFLKDFAKQYPQLVSSIEKSLSDLVQNTKKPGHTKRSYSFAPMNRDQRRVIHELSEFYGTETQSYDNEPMKNVVATATKDKCWLPSAILSVVVQKELHPKVPMPIIATSSKIEDVKSGKPAATPRNTSVLTTLTKSSKTKKEPVIDYFDWTD